MTKGSIGTLLVVALVALAMMTFISFNNDAAGAFSAPHTQMMEAPFAGTSIETTGSDVAQIQLQCYIWLYDHPNVVAPVQIQGLCAKFGVSV